MDYEGPERRKQPSRAELEPVLLRKKFAESLNGVVLTPFEVGDRICLSHEEASMLIGEGWASPVPPKQRRRTPDISC